jgi:hypothetical protein
MKAIVNIYYLVSLVDILSNTRAIYLGEALRIQERLGLKVVSPRIRGIMGWVSIQSDQSVAFMTTSLANIRKPTTTVDTIMHVTTVVTSNE